jgi:hypothetical protein
VEHVTFSEDKAHAIGEAIGIDWTTSRFDVEQFRMGLEVELEHGRRDPETNVSDDDEITTGKIARASERAPRLLHAARADGSRSRPLLGAARHRLQSARRVTGRAR